MIPHSSGTGMSSDGNGTAVGETANIPMPETAVILTYDPKAPERDGLLAGVQLSGLAVPGRPKSGISISFPKPGDMRKSSGNQSLKLHYPSYRLPRQGRFMKCVPDNGGEQGIIVWRNPGSGNLT